MDMARTAAGARSCVGARLGIWSGVLGKGAPAASGAAGARSFTIRGDGC
jgi:hypothetical protein